MKICVLITDYLPDVIGGAELSVHNTSKLLVERGHEVHIITRINRSEKFEILDGVFIHRLLFDRKGLYTFEMMRFLINVALILKKIKPEIFHVHYINMNGPSGVFLGKIFRIPIIVTEHGVFLRKSKIFQNIYGKFVIKNASSMIALNSNLANLFETLCPSAKYKIIGNGIFLKHFNDLRGKKKELRNELDISDNMIKLIYVGRLVEVKKIDRILLAFHDARKKISNLQLIIIGDGEKRSSMESLTKTLGICKYVDFIGFIPHKNVIEFLCASDIFLLTSDFEGQGIVLLEALAAGLPIIVCNFKGSDEIVQDERNGFIVSRNTKEIADKILLLAENENLRSNIRENNITKSDKYDINTIVDEIEKLYREVIEEYPG